MKTLNFKKSGGLIPAIIQNADTKQVLMLGFMDKKAYEKTLKTKKVWFYSRTKKRLWKKGEESGNTLSVVEILPDCDSDTLLIKAKPKGPTCHTGKLSCFGDLGDILQELFGVIQSRKKEMPKDSYTTSLFTEGLNKICAKVEEESGEVIKAAKKETKRRLIEESADVLYHLLVLLAYKNADFKEILTELRIRR